jgi:hypothetical protein
MIFDDHYRLANLTIPLRKPRGSYGGLFSAKYRREPLEAAIVDVLGASKEIKVSEVPRPLVLVATCAVRKAPFVFSNVPPLQTSSAVPLRDALLATAAAPSYFPPVEIDGHTLIDGGLVANAPELVALGEVISKGRSVLEECRIMSIGTARPDPASVPKFVGNRGLARWAPELFSITSHAQERLTVEHAKILLKEAYIRIDATPSPLQASELDIDRATNSATQTLLFLGRRAAEAVQFVDVERFFAKQAIDLP